MALSGKSALRKEHLLLLASTFSTLTAALTVDICADFNTASMAKNVSVYQTNGLCHDFCVSNAAFAITQDNGCWCSDFFPDKGSTVDKSKCNIPCPAWPSESCGGDGLFGYIQLDEVAPSGTKSASSPTTSQAIITSVTASVTKTLQDAVSSSTESPTAFSSRSSSTSDKSRSTPTPTSIVQTVTDGGGAIRTVTVVPTQTQASDDNDDNGKGAPVKKSSGVGTGAIVGIVVGIIAALTAAGAALFYLRRRSHRQDDYREDPSVRGSSSGMIGSGHPEMSMMGAAASSPGSAGNRNSTLQVDPRMDPFKQGLYIRAGSHESVNTLRDDHDYSRRIQPPKVLRAMNPDPE